MTATDSILYYSLYTYLPDTAKIDTSLYIEETRPSVNLPVHTRENFISDWSVILILLLLIAIASIRVTSEKYLYHLISSIFNAQTASRLFRDRVINILHPAFRLEIVFYLSTGLFILEAGKIFMSDFHQPKWLLYIGCTLAVILFTNSKYILYSINGFIFNIQSEVSEYVFYSRTGNRLMGLFLLPFSILLLFIDGIKHEILVVFGLLTMLFFSGISLFKGIKIIALKDFSIYYLILYLCSLEILPLLIVWRILWKM